jgi:hypothetical protein
VFWRIIYVYAVAHSHFPLMCARKYARSTIMKMQEGTL